MQKHPTSPAKDNEALTKVQKWLLSSPQPTVLPKSKSIPLGLTERTHRQTQKGTRKTRPSKSATNLLSGEKTRLQVVFKPPFRFSVKICKSDKTKVVLDKSSKPTRTGRGRKSSRRTPAGTRPGTLHQISGLPNEGTPREQSAHRASLPSLILLRIGTVLLAT